MSGFIDYSARSNSKRTTSLKEVEDQAEPTRQATSTNGNGLPSLGKATSKSPARHSVELEEENDDASDERQDEVAAQVSVAELFEHS